MKLCQFAVPGRGTRVGVVEGDQVIDVTSAKEGVGSVLELIEQHGTAERVERRIRALLKSARTRVPWSDLDRAPSSRRPHLLAPLHPPEVWGAGITYRRSREYYEAHTGDGGRNKGISTTSTRPSGRSCSSRPPRHARSAPTCRSACAATRC
jgi:2-dehydro-3-deoxy-D-arabinonate dehydratase